MANYVDNKKLYEDICAWKQACYAAGEKVQMPNSIGDAIIDIARGFSSFHKFSRYTEDWKEEMVGDAIEIVVKYLDRFDETKYKNPHAYITMICNNCFIQRITQEKKQAATKYSYFVHNVYDYRDPEMASMADEDFIQDIYDKMQKFETSLAKKANNQTEDLPDTSLAFLFEEENESTN